MINTLRKIFRLSPYNRPAPTLADLRDTPTTTIQINTVPEYEVIPTTDGRYALSYRGETIRTYARRRDAIRGLSRIGEKIAA